HGPSTRCACSPWGSNSPPARINALRGGLPAAPCGPPCRNTAAHLPVLGRFIKTQFQEGTTPPFSKNCHAGRFSPERPVLQPVARQLPRLGGGTRQRDGTKRGRRAPRDFRRRSVSH